VKREVYARMHGTLVITLTAEGVYVRTKGRRTEYGPVPYGLILMQGAKAYAAEKLAMKKQARAAKVAARRTARHAAV
jgi:hypothetical protein